MVNIQLQDKQQSQHLDKQRRSYPVVIGWLAMWAAIHLYFVAFVFSNAIFWLNYYVPNYKFGFVRRGLGGEIIAWFPDSLYFPAAYTVLWTSTFVWLIALALLMRHVLSVGARSDRRIMLTLAIPVLPFALSYALYSPHPELFGMAALLTYGLCLARYQTPHATVLISGTYGSVVAVLALAHEAIPLQLALGSVLAVVIVSNHATPAAKRICTLLAVGPGLVSTMLVAALGHRNVSAKLCGQVPHGMVDNPWAATKTPGTAFDYLLGRIESKSDFHDWVCKNTLPILDFDAKAAVQLVMGYGMVRLLGSFILGLIFFLCTVWIIRYLSGVPLNAFLSVLRGHLMLVTLSSALLIPIFATGIDWTRWWIIISADVAIAYILYASSRPEIDQVPPRKTMTVFMWLVIVLAVLPLGAANNVGV